MAVNPLHPFDVNFNATSSAQRPTQQPWLGVTGTPPAANDPYQDPNGYFSGPGYGEQNYRNTKDQWAAPTDSANYWDSVQGKFVTGPTKSTGVSDAYGQWFQPPGQTFGEQGAAAGPRGSYFTNTAYDTRGDLAGPSAAEKFQQGGGPAFAGYDQRGYDQTATDRNTNYTGANINGWMQSLGGETDLERAAGRGASNQSHNSQQTFDRFFDPLSAKSDSENLYGKDPGLGSYYDRAFDTGREKLDNAMAAKGLFSSGAAADETRQLASDLGADRAKNEADYKLRSANQSDTQRLGRMGLAGTLGSSADVNNRAASGQQLDWLKADADTGLARSRESRDWAGQGDQGALARAAENRNWADLLSGNELKQTAEKRMSRADADAQARQRDRANLDWSQTLDANSLNRSADERAWATTGDTSRKTASDSARSWADLLSKETTQNNQDQLDWTKTGADIAGKSDQTTNERLTGGQVSADRAEADMRARYGDRAANLLEEAKLKAGVVGNSVNNSADDYKSALDALLQSKLAAAGNRQNQSEADRNKLDQDIALLYQILNDGSSRKAGGAASPPGQYPGAAD